MNEKNFAWNAADYAQNSTAQMAWAQELLGKLNLQPDESVLDIGCGDGKITLAIAEYVPQGQVVGIDSSASMISLAQQNLARSNCRNVQFSLMDATALTFEKQFDVVFSNAALHWTQKHLAVLAGIKKSLKPSGRLLLQMGGQGNARDIISILEQMMALVSWRKYFQDFAFPYGFYGVKEYEAWLQQVGLLPIRVELLPKDMQQAGKEGLAGWIRTTWLPYTERIPARLRETFITELVDKYVQAFPMDAQGNVHVAMVRLEVAAHNVG